MNKNINTIEKVIEDRNNVTPLDARVFIKTLCEKFEEYSKVSDNNVYTYISCVPEIITSVYTVSVSIDIYYKIFTSLIIKNFDIKVVTEIFDFLLGKIKPEDVSIDTILNIFDCIYNGTAACEMLNVKASEIVSEVYIKRTKLEDTIQIEVSRKIYDRFKLHWLTLHGYGLNDIISMLDNSEGVSNKFKIRQWEYENNEPNGIYPCYEEFIANEYQNKEFVESELIVNNEELITYRKHLEALNG